MFIDRKFPNTRLRRLRSSSNILDLVSENRLSSDDLIQPVFIKENMKGTEAIESMPGILRHGLNSIAKEVENIVSSGIKTIALFPVIESSKKDASGTEASNKNNLICESIRLIKESFPEVIIIADVALDPYTDHGHDGIIKKDYVDNDLTLEILKSQSLVLAEAGADIIVPHMGLTTGGAIGAETSLSLEDCVECIDSWTEAAQRINPDIIVLCHGGPISNPIDAEYVLQNTKSCHGFYGASSIERLPTEIAITDQTKMFVEIEMNPLNKNEIQK